MSFCSKDWNNPYLKNWSALQKAEWTSPACTEASDNWEVVSCLAFCETNDFKAVEILLSS